MIGFAFLALALLPQQALTADEIKARLEQPVTLQTDPARLPIVLDQLGSLVGVHIRSEALLNRAIVVVSVRNKPAKEVFAKLVNGIGAGSMIQNGEIVVGMEVATPEEEAKLDAEYTRTMKGWSENLYKTRECDQEIDQKALDRIASAGMLDLQSSSQDGGIRYQSRPAFYQTLAKNPAARFTARLYKIVGPELLSANPDDDSLYLSMRDLSESKQREVLNALGILRREQDNWAKTFAQLNALAAKIPNPRIQMPIGDAEPMDKAELTGFKISIYRKDRNVLVEVMSGNTPVLETQDYIPSKRQRSVRVEGERYDLSKAPVFNVPLGEKPLKFFAMLNPSPTPDQKPVILDPTIRKMVADPWKNEPLSFSRVQPVGQVAEKMDLNLVAYLSDQLLYLLLYSMQPGSEVSSRELLQGITYGMGRGLFKKDDWLTVSVGDPETYLRQQIDRATLGKFLGRAFKPGCLTLEEYCTLRQAIGRSNFTFALGMAGLIQPGFEALNAFAPLLDFYSELNLAQRSQLVSGGIPIASLPTKARSQAIGMGQSYGGYRRPGDPEGLVNEPPTKVEMMRAKIVMRSQVTSGLLARFGDTGDPNSVSRFSSFSFQDLDSFLGQPDKTIEILNSLPSPFARLCHRIERVVQVDIPRKQGVKLAIYEYDADLSTPSVRREQLETPVLRYLGG